MSENQKRLGDLIDDYCPRCRLLLNHAIASMVELEVAKVICQTCYTEHPYRHGEGGKKKSPNPRTTLFEQVLARATPSPAVGAPSPGEKPARKKSARPARYVSRHETRVPKGSQ
jgi:hypothetical protein